MKKTVALILSIWMAQPAMAESAEAVYADPVSVYNHNIFATPHEFASISIPNLDTKLTIPQTGKDAAVFEGLAPISWRDDDVMVLATESSLSKGARLALYGWSAQSGWRVFDKTEPIGQSNRWLALSWFGDMDGDGNYEVGYVETPHIGGVLKLYEIVDNQFEFKAELAGFSNHKIGDDVIYGGPALCGSSQKWFVPDRNFENWMEISWDGNAALSARAISPLGTYPNGCQDLNQNIHGKL